MYSLLAHHTPMTWWWCNVTLFHSHERKKTHCTNENRPIGRQDSKTIANKCYRWIIGLYFVHILVYRCSLCSLERGLLIDDVVLKNRRLQKLFWNRYIPFSKELIITIRLIKRYEMIFFLLNFNVEVSMLINHLNEYVD